MANQQFLEAQRKQQEVSAGFDGSVQCIGITQRTMLYDIIFRDLRYTWARAYPLPGSGWRASAAAGNNRSDQIQRLLMK